MRVFFFPVVVVDGVIGGKWREGCWVCMYVDGDGVKRGLEFCFFILFLFVSRLELVFFSPGEILATRKLSWPFE